MTRSASLGWPTVLAALALATLMPYSGACRLPARAHSQPKLTPALLDIPTTPPDSLSSFITPISVSSHYPYHPSVDSTTALVNALVTQITMLTMPCYAPLQLYLSDSRVYAAGAVASTARMLADSLRVGIRVPTDEFRAAMGP